MRTMIVKLATAIGLVTASAAPALACGGGGLFSASSCSPCGQAYVSPCAQGYGYGQGYSYGYAGVQVYQQLPQPTPQYYYASQGPSFSGPGNYAPYPTYQETALGYNGGYGGGYDQQPAYRAPAVYSYRPRMHHGYSSYRSYAPRYGYRHRRFAGPHMTYAPRYAAPGHYRPHHQYPLRRLY